MKYEVIWLLATVSALVAGVAVVGFGCFLLRPSAFDDSNSLEIRSFVARTCRALPGLAVAGAGIFLISKIAYHVISLKVPAP